MIQRTPREVIILTGTGEMPTVPVPFNLTPLSKDWKATDIMIGQTAYNVADAKYYTRDSSGIVESVAYGGGGIGTLQSDILDRFEIVNKDLENEYIRVKKPFSSDYDIQAFGNFGQFPSSIWDSLPIATPTSMGGFKLNSDQFEFNGSGQLTIKSGILTPAQHNHLWAEITDKPTAFVPESHTLISHTASGLTAGDFLRATSANTFGFAAITKQEIQALLSDWFEIAGTTGNEYLKVKYSLATEGDIQAFSNFGGFPSSIWDSLPLATTTTIGGIKLNSSQFEYNGSDQLTIKAGILVPASHSHAWGDITSGIPSTFAPSAHNHAWGDITSGIPSTFTPSSHGLIGAVHTITGKTTGHFLRAKDNDAYDFEALTAADVKTVLTDWFEYVANSGNPYLRVKLPIGCDGEIQAFTSSGQFPQDIWSSLPQASTSAYGVVKIGSGIGVTNGVISVTSGAGMVYPSGSGIAIVSGGNSWGTTITDNSSQWNAAYSHSQASHAYLPLAGGTMSNTTVVTNLNADLLDGLHSVNYFLNAFAPTEDLNTIVTAGNYRVAGSNANLPVGVNGYGQLLSLRGTNSDTRTQIYGAYETGDLFTRSGADGYAWNGWYKLWSSGNSNLSTVDWLAKQFNAGNTSGYLLREDSGSGYGIYKGATTRIGIAANGTEWVSVLSDGNVGIGTTAPASQLTLGGYGNVEMSTGNSNGYITHLYTAPDGNDNFSFGANFKRTAYNSGTVPSAVLGTAEINLHTSGTGNGVGIINFLTGAVNTVPTLKMTIINNGYVGIGTTAPLKKLEVTGDVMIGVGYGLGFRYDGTTDATMYSKITGSGANPLNLFGGLFTTNLATEAIRFSTYSGTAMSIYNSGYVGINTSTDGLTQVLINSVAGSANNAGLKVQYAGGTDLGEVSMLAHRHGGWMTLYINDSGSSANYALYSNSSKPSYFSGSVGIGRTPSTYKLEVEGAVYVGTYILAAGNSIALGNMDGDQYGLFQDNISIATYDTAAEHYVYGGGGVTMSSGNINATGEVTAYYSSDSRLKRCINEFSSLDLIDHLYPKTFYWNEIAKGLNPMKSDSLQYGLIAQEVEQVMPELVHTIYGKYKSVDYVSLIPILLQAVKELKEEVKNLKHG